VYIKLNKVEKILLLIIGKNSNLTHSILKKYDNTVSISSNEILTNVDILKRYKETNVVILFNNFQSAKYLNRVDNIEDYVNRSLTVTAKVLDYLKSFTNIQKIIYTSSSSVYGDNECCSEDDIPHPINLQASLKLSNEFFIKQYCKEYKVDYTILRVFNMYGGDDNFSVISKIINAVVNNIQLTLVNNGSGIRDFVHIDDVVEVILKLLYMKNIPILNIGTGRKMSVKDIVSYLQKHGFNVATQNVCNDNEIKISIANSQRVEQIIEKDFIKVEEYILNEVRKEDKPV